MSKIRFVPVAIASSVVSIVMFAALRYFQPAIISEPHLDTPLEAQVELPPTKPLEEAEPAEPEKPLATVASDSPAASPAPRPPKVSAKALEESKNVEKMMTKWPTANSHLKELREAEKKFLQHMHEAMQSEEKARLALKDLEDCVKNAPRLKEAQLSEKLPKEVQDTIRNSVPSAQASCISYALEIAQRYSVLKGHVEDELLKKATPEAQKQVEKLRSTTINHPLGM